MKRQALAVGLALLAGLGAGYALGIHRRSSTVPATPVAPTTQTQSIAQPATPTAANARPATVTAEEARQRLTAWVTSKNAGMEHDQIRKCLTLWSESDPHAVLEFVELNLNGDIRDYAFAFPLAVLGRQNPQAVVDWLRERACAADRSAIARFTIELLTKSSPSTALTIAETLPLNLSILQQTFLLGSLASHNPTEAQTAFSKLPSYRRNEVALAVGRGLAQNDPHSALQWCSSLDGSPESIGAMQGVVAELARSLGDERALDAISQLHPSQEALDEISKTLRWDSAETALALLPKLSAKVSAELAERFINDGFTETPDEMLALARTYLPPEKANASLSAAWADWRNTQRDAADAWLAKLTNPEQRSLFEPVKLRYLAGVDPTIYLERIAPMPFAATERETIEEALGEVSHAQAAQWVASNPKILSPEQTARTIARYYEQEASAASAWALILPHGDGQDQALAAVALASLKKGNFVNATSLLAAISAPQLQTSTQFKAFSTLYQKDRAAARAWLETQPVAPAIRANWETLADSGISSE